MHILPRGKTRWSSPQRSQGALSPLLQKDPGHDHWRWRHHEEGAQEINVNDIFAFFLRAHFSAARLSPPHPAYAIFPGTGSFTSCFLKRSFLSDSLTGASWQPGAVPHALQKCHECRAERRPRWQWTERA